MPPATFMQIDERRDHSIRVPRPDHSVEFGTPNACNGCHGKESATWARDWTRKWYPALEQRHHFVEALGKDRKGAADAGFELRALALDAGAPAIARATALERLGDYPSAKTLATLRQALGQSEALLVYGAALGATRVPFEQRVPLLLPLLEHDVLAVRIAAGKALAGAPVNKLPANAEASLQRVFSEIDGSFEVNASRAETHVEQSAVELSRGNLDAAAAAVGRALRIEPCLVEALLNQAELERLRGAEPEAERAIRRALACEPRSAGAHHALGLWLVRAKQPAAGRQSLARAVALDPRDVRFSYVLAVALASAGATDEAASVLEASLTHHPNHIGSLQALSRYLTELGQVQRAAELQHRAEQLQ
jgi:Tfp pilus assembly protein PilF